MFSRLDVESAYNSFKVDEPSQEVLSFTFDGQTYKWIGTCFGLKFVTSQFCRVMNIIFDGEANIATYVDDCCIFSDPEDHAEIVKRAIDKLTNANLKINYEKCTFFKTSIYMLGFVVGPGITKIDQRRLSNIDEWPIPKSAQQVRKVMGVVSHLRAYVPMISKIAAPLDALRNDKNVLEKWTPFHTERLENIKKILMSKAILHTPKMDQKMYLETDASQYAASAILTQRDKHNRTVIIAMASTSLPPAAQNWSVNRRELFAIYYGFQRFRSVLLGHPNIEVWTDHKAITFYYTTHLPNRTIQSYMEVLSEFNFTVTYIKGLDNVLPDLLSRLYPPFEEDKELEDEDNKKIKQLNRIILERRKKNPLSSYKAGDKVTSTDRFIYKHEIRSTDKQMHVLAVKLDSKKHKEDLPDYITPPIEERQKLLLDAHKLGHFGTDSIVKAIHSDGLHWTGIFTEAKQIVNECIDCARHNVTRKGYHPLKSLIAADPFAHIATDMAGPFSVTSNNNVYILVVVDICTRYIIARALPNKQSDTIANALCQIFGDYGLPTRAMVSDNGKEYRNGLLSSVTKTLGFTHRFSTPYYPQANGCAENAVKIIVNTVRKMCGNDTSRWDAILPAAQLCCNLKIRDRTGSSPFSLMFARKFPIIQEDPDANQTPLPKLVITTDDLIKKAEYMASIVFPAIHDRTKALMEVQQKTFNDKHYLIDIPIGSVVMVKLPSRTSKLSPLYEGPFTVITKTKNGTYVLKDSMNELLHRDYVPSELKMVSIDETAIEDELYEVKEIRDHRGPDNDREYLVCWVGYGERENSWLKADAFSDPETIRKYWVKVNKQKQLDQDRNRAMVKNYGNKQMVNKQTSIPKKTPTKELTSKKRKSVEPQATLKRQRVLRSKTKKQTYTKALQAL